MVEPARADPSANDIPAAAIGSLNTLVLTGLQDKL